MENELESQNQEKKSSFENEVLERLARIEALLRKVLHNQGGGFK